MPGLRSGTDGWCGVCPLLPCSYGVICHHKKSAYPYANPESYYGDDSELLIKHKVRVLEQLGSGGARLDVLEHPKTVKIDKQRGLQVATLSGSL